jgi:hypothetical protein
VSWVQLLLVLACFSVVLAGWTCIVGALLARKEARLRQEASDLFKVLVTPPDEKTPSALAVYTDQLAILLARQFVQQLKTMLAGTESGLSKAAAAGQQLELIESGPPWLQLLAGILPKRLKSQILRNPQMLSALSSMVAGGNHGSGESSPSRTVEE